MKGDHLVAKHLVTYFWGKKKKKDLEQSSWLQDVQQICSSTVNIYMCLFFFLQHSVDN